jgi:energy-converting hydrogenase Eha subunit E
LLGAFLNTVASVKFEVVVAKHAFGRKLILELCTVWVSHYFNAVNKSITLTSAILEVIILSTFIALNAIALDTIFRAVDAGEVSCR